ncbi:MAG TPA: glycosyltransferase, partial [Vicinamibacterales bacterium]|nr:glycosyltransferase [Vicinamibacterales bacterium]
RVFVAFERLLIRASRVIIVICPHLEETVHEIEPRAQAVLIENAPGPTDAPPSPDAVAAVRREFGLAASTPVVLYTGTLEAYQGLELLMAAARQVAAARPDVRFLLAGGKPDQVARLRDQARAAGVEDVLLLAGQRPAQDIPAFLEAADVLVSPRSRGTNTPLKIYQYLRSGRPIVATRLLTHTQVLNDAVAMLTEPTPDDYARGILALLDDPARARAIGERARELADTKYTYAAYLARTREAFARLTRPGAAELAKDPA